MPKAVRLRGVQLILNRVGVRSQLAASVKADPASEYAMQNYDHGNASLAVKIRISVHARESQFFGEVTARVSYFSPIDGVPEQVIWQDARCHQRRGLPKETVTSIDGLITSENVQIRVQARARYLSLRLPLDEIISEQGFPTALIRVVHLSPIVPNQNLAICLLT